jgi:hypothetical protein
MTHNSQNNTSLFTAPSLTLKESIHKHLTSSSRFRWESNLLKSLRLERVIRLLPWLDACGMSLAFSTMTKKEIYVMTSNLPLTFPTSSTTNSSIPATPRLKESSIKSAERELLPRHLMLSKMHQDSSKLTQTC